MSGEFICRHHDVPWIELFAPEEATFPIPLMYIDVMNGIRLATKDCYE